MEAGLHLLIQPAGSKLWRLAYRFAGKQKTLALGVYPIVSLEEARRRRDEAKKFLARSIDPSLQRKADKQAGKDSSFRTVAEEVIAKQEQPVTCLRYFAKLSAVAGLASRPTQCED